jgi:hypothetical protein
MKQPKWLTVLGLMLLFFILFGIGLGLATR